MEKMNPHEAAAGVLFASHVNENQVNTSRDRSRRGQR